MKHFVKKTIKQAAPQLVDSLLRLTRVEQKLDELNSLMQEGIKQAGSHDFRLDKLKVLAQEVEPYQPTYAVAGVLAEEPRRDSLDRARAIELYLGNPAGLRMLDIGSSLGYMCYYFADRAAITEGWEAHAKNAEVSRLVGDINGIHTAIKTKQFNDETVTTIPVDHYDAVFILSVLHHITHYNGLEYTQKLMQELMQRVPMVIVELASRDEDKKLFWNDAQPKDPLAVFDLVRDEVDIKKIGSFHNHLSKKARPLYAVTRKRVVVVNGKRYSYSEKKNQAYSRSPMVFSPSLRRYYISEKYVIKEYDFANETSGENKRQIIAEIDNLLHLGLVHHVPQLVDFEITSERARLVLVRAPGGLLSDLIDTDQEIVLKPIIRDVLKSLRDLHAQGLSHNDVRSWNIVVHGKTGRLIDYGLVSYKQTDDDIVSVLWTIHAALTHDRQGYEQNKPMPPRRPFVQEKDFLELYDAVKKGERDPASLLKILS